MRNLLFSLKYLNPPVDVAQPQPSQPIFNQPQIASTDVPSNTPVLNEPQRLSVRTKTTTKPLNIKTHSTKSYD